MASSPGTPAAPNRMASALRATSSVASGSGSPAESTPACPIGASTSSIDVQDLDRLARDFRPNPIAWQYCDLHSTLRFMCGRRR
jgi:hypothetical protein